MRKIIQIAIDSAPDGESTTYLYALCDDGTIWFSEGGPVDPRSNSNWILFCEKISQTKDE